MSRILNGSASAVTEVVAEKSNAFRIYESPEEITESVRPDLPDVWHKRPEDQIGCLILAWVLFIYRGRGYSEDGGFTCEYVGSNGKSSFSKFAGSAADFISGDNDRVSRILETVKSSLAIYFDTGDVAGFSEKCTMLLSNSNSEAEGTKSNVRFFCIFEAIINPRKGLTLRNQLPFALEISTSEQSLSAKMPQKPHYLSHETVTLQVNAFADTLKLVFLNQDQSVAQTVSLHEDEQKQIWTWNAAVPPSINSCIHEIFMENAARGPNREAVVSWDGSFTYGELDELSTYLAQRLIEMGVRVGQTVPLCFEKSKWTVVGVLAVMKSGGALALTDPSQPEARLQTIVTEVDAKVVLTSEKQAALGSKVAPNADIVVVGPGLAEVNNKPTYPTHFPRVPPHSTLYIIFTSGSTGKPKGVVISHSNYSSGAIPRAEAIGYGPHSRVLDFPSYAFDVSVDCMLCTLAQGGCVCVPSEEERVNNLSGAIRGMQVNMAHMTPSVARVLDEDVMSSLEVLGLGGESVSARDASNWGRKTRLIIAYGPSECTVGCTINNDVKTDRPYSSIGKGVGGTTWIVDPADNTRLAPIGAVGELWIEGPVVGTGYLNDPEKTALAFVEDPPWLIAGASNVPGRHGRFYKTGDLVKYDPDGSGSIVFVGRADQQVKLRGQRVELGEVEHNLRVRLPDFVSVVAEVIHPGGNKGDASLVAFIADKREGTNHANGEVSTISEELHKILEAVNKDLSTALPRYMVPSAYIPLREIPLLVSCKVDRKQLRAIGSSMSRQQLARLKVTIVEKKEPQTEMEHKVHGLWKRLFGEDAEIGSNDNFFDLGGDSLSAMKLVALAREDGFSITVANIFRCPKLSDMALTVGLLSQEDNREITEFSLLGANWTADAARTETSHLCNVEENEIEDVYPCTPLQEGLMALSAKVKEAYVAQRVVEVEGLHIAHKLKDAFELSAKDCAILRTRILQVPHRGLMQVIIKSEIPWRSANDLEEYLRQDRDEQMGLGTSLVRFGIVNDCKLQKVYFVLTIHHALYDGWSMPLVVDRVNRAYHELQTERSAPFKSFIKYLTDLDRPASEAYWREMLHEAAGRQFPILPYSGYQTQPESLLEHYVTLPRRSASSTSIATAIRGAWALVAAQYTASSDVVFGETLTGRNAPVKSVEDIEGPMITTIPVRVRIDNQLPISEYLQDIHSQTVDRIPHEHIGLQHIRRLSPDAREACDLKTGLVIHPTTSDEDANRGQAGPADGFVPAGDEEAAREALKFNSYALMLVCSLDPQGFLIMASFDSKTVGVPEMQTALESFGKIVQRFCEKPDEAIGIQEITEQEQTKVLDLSRAGVSSFNPVAKDIIGNDHAAVESTWIVSPDDSNLLAPVGAVGELLIESKGDIPLSSIDRPHWFNSFYADNLDPQTRLYKTNHLARYKSDGTLILMGNKDAESQKSATQKRESKKQLSVTTTEQRKLRQLWSRVLEMEEEEIALNDSFFDLGGDSIGAMKLVSEARMEGLKLNVAQIFRHRNLLDIAGIVEASEPLEKVQRAYTPFSVAGIDNIEEFVSEEIRPVLSQKSWNIVDILPARPLQKVAVNGTVNLPRYSARYELFYLDASIDTSHLFASCQELVDRNEILRTVFVETGSRCFGVVLEKVEIPIVEYDVDGKLEDFAQNLCNVDVQGKMPHGSLFAKFFYVHCTDGRSCLILRISHAQYDEICLPILLGQLSAIYEGRDIPKALPFSSFVGYVVQENIPESIQYWRDLLQGASMSVLRPDTPIVSKHPVAIAQTFDISARSKETTIATLPTAAWAACLARRLATRDVTFGEVVSGRNTEFPNSDMVMGPCWQYVPVRVKFQPDWTALDLLNFVQHQHITSTRYEGIGLNEIVENCTDWPSTVDWFDSVVHQDVKHVEELGFLSATSRMDTVYPHAEPLKEWKIQAFLKDNELTIEIVTFESWSETAKSLLNDLGDIVRLLVNEPHSAIF